MEENENHEQEVNIKKKKFNFRFLLVTIVLIVFSISSYVSLRAEYLKIREINPKYTSVFIKNFTMKSGMFAVVMLVTYILFYVNNTIIKKGLSVLFNEEKKVMPKLPNKSIAFIAGIIAGITSLKFLYTKEKNLKEN